MKLNHLLANLQIMESIGSLDLTITNIQYNSHHAKQATLFICIKGFNSDGHNYIQNTIQKGTRAFLVQNDTINYKQKQKQGCSFIRVSDTRSAMSIVAANFYNHPSKFLDVIGVTGTNGKTSTTIFLKQILSYYGNKTGLIGTISIFDGQKNEQAERSTPQSLEVQKYLRNMVQNGCSFCAMEVTSHSLVLNRVDNVQFKLGLFTNLTHDHLDFHKDMEQYRQAKERLFYKTSFGNLINIDDEWGVKIYNNIKNLKTPVFTYGLNNDADFKATNIKIKSQGVSYKVKTPSSVYDSDIFVPIPGRFTVYNTLAVFAACFLLKIPREVVVEGLARTKGAPGRFERIENNKGLTIIIDYAHTPDGLQKVLLAAGEFKKGRIITVFGCGGDRDEKKRPIMGEIGQKLSDRCIITSDNPRTQDPSIIIGHILKGVDKDKQNYQVIIDRKQAIFHAIKIANEGDIVMIVGKGHQNYQIVGKVKYHFDDKQVVAQALQLS